jgi:hypothetical protein
MDCVKNAFTMKVHDLTPDFIDSWKFEDAIQGVTQRLAPFLTHLLHQASQTAIAQQKNQIKKPDKVRLSNHVADHALTNPSALQHCYRSTRALSLLS